MGRPSIAGAVDVVVIGAGHSGLAMSRCLGERSIDHVVLERGDIANAWRHERWDSLRLLTPNWQNSLPGYRYSGPEPDGFMTMPEVIDFVASYAQAITAPVRTDTRVTSVSETINGFRVSTDHGDWRCRAVVMATGSHGVPHLPSTCSVLPDWVTTMTANRYRNPAQLDDRGVLIVGASATGVQLADEITRSGRKVVLATGEHVRMPRRYRGKDIQWWLSTLRILDQRYDEIDDIVRARRIPSAQLIGTTDDSMLDLNALMARGVRITGRLAGVVGNKALFSGSLLNQCALADLKLSRLLRAIDEWISANPAADDFPPPQRFAPTLIDDLPPLSMDLRAEGIGTVLWATGYRPDYSWLNVPAFDHKGRLRHDGGIAAVPGLYTLGHNFMRRRKSSFICGAEDDTRDLSTHLDQYLHAGARATLHAVS